MVVLVVVLVRQVMTPAENTRLLARVQENQRQRSSPSVETCPVGPVRALSQVVVGKEANAGRSGGRGCAPV
ncbi:hypothetical protein FRAHR75_1340010 [Frankia sp. Hr75.2]|nr:hypothetical protein FRAHR75_1340010 [Frankia sp. Hr75.2]